MIDIKIGLNGIPNQTKIDLGNKYENEDETIKFELDPSFEMFNKYLIGVYYNKKTKEKRTTVLPVLNNRIVVSSELTYFDGIWELYLMAREHKLDLSQTPIVLSPMEGEHVFISDMIRGIVKPSSIDKDSLIKMPVDSNLKIIYDDLIALIQQVTKARDNGEFDGFSPTVSIQEGVGERTITITDRAGAHSTVLKDYVKSAEHQALVDETKAAAQASQTSATNAKASEDKASLQASEAVKQANLAKDFADKANTNQLAIAGVEQRVKASEAEVLRAEGVIATAETNAKASETKAKTSETNAELAKTNASSFATQAKKSLDDVTLIKGQIDAKEQNISKMNDAVGLKAQQVQNNVVLSESHANTALQVKEAVDLAKTEIDAINLDLTQKAEQANTSALHAKQSEDNINANLVNIAYKKDVETKLDKNLGVVNRGKVLTIDELGEVKPDFNSGLIAQPNPPENKKVIWIDTDDSTSIENEQQMMTYVENAAGSALEAKKAASDTKALLQAVQQGGGNIVVNTDYNNLTNHPSINNVALKGNKTLAELGIVIPTKISDLKNDSNFLTAHQSLDGYALKSELPVVPAWAMNASKPTYTAKEVGALPANTVIPTKVSELANDSGYLTKHQDISSLALKTEIPTKTSELQNDSGYLTQHQDLSKHALKSELPKVPAWALAPAKPSYTATEVGALPSSTTIPTKVSQLTNDKGFLTSHQDLSAYALKSELPAVPTNVSSFNNDAGYLTKEVADQTYSTQKVKVLTQVQYDQIVTKDPSTLYVITE